MKRVTIRLPDALHQRLAAEAKAAKRSLSAIIREKLETQSSRTGRSSYEHAAELAGVLDGGKRSATNARRKFRRA